MALPKTIRLESRSIKLAGGNTNGANMEWTIVCYKETRGGLMTEHRVVLQCCRSGITEVLEQIKAMHKRDRDRLKWQGERIDAEAKVLT